MKLTRHEGWYSVQLTFNSRPELELAALLNPPQSASWITVEALDHLKRWELVDLADREVYPLRNLSIQGQAIPDLEVRPMPATRRVRWDLVLGANFFSPYTDLHLNIPSLVARLIDP